MRSNPRLRRCWLPALVCLAAAAQPARAQEFPQDATVPTAAEIQQHLAGKVFRVKVADGASWRLEYNTLGYWFINTSTGFNDSGAWRAEAGRLCAGGKRIPDACSEVRFKDGAFLLKRASNGEIVQFVPN